MHVSSMRPIFLLMHLYKYMAALIIGPGPRTITIFASTPEDDNVLFIFGHTLHFVVCHFKCSLSKRLAGLAVNVFHHSRAGEKNANFQ